jgi:L-lactate dehydrogenase complex protein LldF
VYERTGGHAYGSVYPGPIGAILTPQLQGPPHAQTLPFASTLCGACYDVCPVKINIPEILVHLRAQVHDNHTSRVERIGFGGIAWVLSKGARIRAIQRLNLVIAPSSRIPNWFSLPVLRGWTSSRRSPAWARTSFRQWWESR